MFNRKEHPDKNQVSEEQPGEEIVRAMTQEEKQERDKLMNDLENAVGSYCEVRDMDNLLLVLGHIEKVEWEKGAITVRSTEREMPIVIFNTDFKLMIRPRGGVPLVLNGKVCGSTRNIWKLDQLRRYFYKESRNFFRQPTDTNAYATCINALYGPAAPESESENNPVIMATKCRVMDVSLQGIQLRAQELCFFEGDWLLLTDLALVPQQKRKHTFICQVRRAAPAGRGEFLFGCQFHLLSDQQQDTLCSDIFVLHRLDIQASRMGS